MTDNFYNNGGLIYRGLYKNKKCSYAHSINKHDMLMIIAYSEFYGHDKILKTFGSPHDMVQRYRKMRKEERLIRLQKKLIKKQIPIWP